MPISSKKPCNTHNCPKTTHNKYCDDHIKPAATQANKWRGTPASRGYDYSWVKVREQILKRDMYMCQNCLLSGRPTQATSVHHKIKLTTAPQLRLEPSNLLSVCNTCHELLERTAQ